ncbi:MAG: riboflavin synthase [Opitutales bacterium]
MFTGIVEGTGEVITLEELSEAWRLTLETGEIASDLAIGDSLAINGCCLTVVARDGSRLAFDLLEETLRLTSLKQAVPGLAVNLERALAADGRLGGHFVSGHIDGLGEILEFETRGKNAYLRVSAPPQFLPYIVYKGSVSIDGISLTIAEEHTNGLAVWLIPHTVNVTNLRERHVGDYVNLEFDLLAKYAEKILRGERDG